MAGNKIIAVTAALLCGSSMSAYAADQLASAPTTAPSSYSWDGVYFGIGGGFGAVVHEFTVPPLGGVNFNGIGGEGVFGELTIGYDHVINDRTIVGIYGNYRFGEIATELSVPGLPFSADVTLDTGYDIIGRLGYAFTPSSLGYVLAGYSHQEFDLSTSVGFGFDFDRSGYVIGAGLETVLADNWALKTEYRYGDYGTESFVGGLLEVSPSTHTAHASLVYRLNGGYTEAADVSPVNYDFAGWKIGFAAGSGAVVHEINVPPLGGASFNGIGGEGVFAEASAGYDTYIADNIVAGISADVRFGNIETELNVPGLGVGANLEADLGFDIIGRLGYEMADNALIYGLGGYAYQEFDIGISGVPFAVPNLDFELDGWTVGGGIEIGLTEDVSAKVEYRYAEYDDEDFGTGGIFTLTPSTHTVRVGVTRKLN